MHSTWSEIFAHIDVGFPVRTCGTWPSNVTTAAAAVATMGVEVAEAAVGMFVAECCVGGS